MQRRLAASRVAAAGGSLELAGWPNQQALIHTWGTELFAAHATCREVEQHPRASASEEGGASEEELLQGASSDIGGEARQAELEGMRK